MENNRSVEEEIQWTLFLISGERALEKHMEELSIDEVPERILSLDLDKIAKWLRWILAFIQFFNSAFKNKNGEYRKPGFWRYVGIVAAIFPLGLKLLGIIKT